MICDCAIGESIVGFFAVRNVNVSTARNGSTFLSCVLSDGQMELPAKQWDLVGIPPRENTVIKVQAVMDRYQGQPQLVIQRWREAEPGEYKPDQFIPKSPLDPASMWQELQCFIGQIQHPGLSRLVDIVLNNYTDAFISCPGAVKHHHAYIGGLLEHTLGVCKNALAVATDNCNKDLLLAGAILHDIGKIQTYDWKGCNITVTDEGKLLGHIVIGAKILESCMSANPPPELDKKTHNALLHLLISHHGKLEWGSPVEPMMKEAVILHAADMLDAQLWKMSRAEAEAEAGEERKQVSSDCRFRLSD